MKEIAIPMHYACITQFKIPYVKHFISVVSRIYVDVLR